jgi:hypothetical protein
VTAAKNIPNSEKKKLLRSLTLALRAARPIQFPTNIELVQKYYDKIDVTNLLFSRRSTGREIQSALRKRTGPRLA